MADLNKNSPKYIEAREFLPKDLWPFFDQLVKEYIFFTMMRHGRRHVSFKVLADLIQAGWRPS